MTDYGDNYFHDAAEDHRASYDVDPAEWVDGVEEEPDFDSLPDQGKAIVSKLAAQWFEKIIRWVSDEVPLSGKATPGGSVLKSKTTLLRAVAMRYVTHPESFGERVSAAEIARRLGISKQRFNCYIAEFRTLFKFQGQTMRTAEQRENMRAAMRASHARRKQEGATPATQP